MGRLDDISVKFGTDKGSLMHGYTEYYEPVFSKYNNPTILEIGVLNGASLKMYNEFYNGNCNIVCADIEDKTPVVGGMENVSFFKLNQGKEDEWDAFLEKTNGMMFDIILDDGSHRWLDQMVTLYKLYKRVKPNGVYILEDLHTSFFVEQYSSLSPLHWVSFVESDGVVSFDYKKTNELKNAIKDVVVYNIMSRGKGNEFYKNRSVTSVITFKQ